jgi:hypothetical protein
MAKKGLKSLAESTPNFSNQALENAVDNLKIGWVAKSIELDTAITDSTVLTDSQKNDLKDTINNVAHLNAGRYLNDLERHTASIIDGSIMPLDTTIVNPEPGSFLEILQLVQTLQTLIPDLFGVTPEEKNRGVNDHLGTLNNIFLETEDSSEPVFTSLQRAITFIDNASLATDTTYQTAIDDLKNFVVGLAGDSTDFQTSLDNRAATLATAQTNFNNALASEPYLTKRTQLVADRDKINTQVNLENTNLNDIRTYSDTLTDNLSFTSLAEDTGLRKLMSNVAQNPNWRSYFDNYEQNEENLNPLYSTEDDSSKGNIIDLVLRTRGLPDVVDPLDLDAVLAKAKRDSRINTKNFNTLQIDKQIEECCVQLGIKTFGNVYNQSQRLLDNLNQRDRDIVQEQLNLNEDADTIS